MIIVMVLDFRFFIFPSGSMDQQYVLRQARLSLKVLVTVVTLFDRQGGEWQVIWCLGSHQINPGVGSLCINMRWFFNFFLLQRILKQKLQKWQLGPRIICYHTLVQHQAFLYILLIPPLPLHLLLIFITLLLLLPILLLLPLRQEVWKASRTSLLSCKDL